MTNPNGIYLLKIANMRFSPKYTIANTNLSV